MMLNFLRYAISVLLTTLGALSCWIFCWDMIVCFYFAEQSLKHLLSFMEMRLTALIFLLSTNFNVGSHTNMARLSHVTNNAIKS